MSLNTIELTSGPAPQASIIILHGLGADGEDFVPICHELDLSAAGPVRYVLPSAPAIPVSINGGYVMRAWYDIRQPGQGPREDEAGLRQSQQAIHALIEREIAQGIPASRIVLMGFSQGCAMAPEFDTKCRKCLICIDQTFKTGTTAVTFGRRWWVC